MHWSHTGAMAKAAEPQTKLVKPRTKAGKRALEKRAPKLVRRRDCSPGLGGSDRQACGRRQATCMLPPPPAARRPPPRCHPACPRQVEEPRRALLVHGNKTSQVIKDVMTDLQKLKGVRATLPPPPCALFAAAHG